jgi:hypothetical protein
MVNIKQLSLLLLKTKIVVTIKSKLIVLFLVLFTLRIEAALSQTPKPLNQIPTTLANNYDETAKPQEEPLEPTPETSSTTTEPINQTPTTTTKKPVILDETTTKEDTKEDTGEFVEPLDPEQVEEKANELEGNLKSPQNPFSKPDIDKILFQQFNDDIWVIMRGGLPCIETTSICLQQLQEKAIANSPLLRELDTRIEEANGKVQEAKTRNEKVIKLSVLSPALQYLLGPAVTPGQPQAKGKGLIDNLVGLFTGDVGLLNGLLNVIGVPLFVNSQGANAEANRNAIAISDIQVKIAKLQRSRAQLSDSIKQQVILSLSKFDELKTDFQVSQLLSLRHTQQFKIFELRYTRGNNSTEAYLAEQSRLDRSKGRTYTAWGKMKRSLFEIKLLVLGVKNSEI